METYPYILFAIFASMIYAFWKAGSWLMSNGKAVRDRESLSPADLDALTRACEDLISDLRSAADDCTARVENSIRKAEIIASKLDQSVPSIDKLQIVLDEGDGALGSAAAPVVVDGIEPVQTDPMLRVYQLADQGRSPAEIARLEKRPIGEIKLMLDLRKLQSPGTPPL